MKYISLVLAPALGLFSTAGCAARPEAHSAAEPAKPPAGQAQAAGPYANLNAVATGSHIVDTDPKTGKILWTAQAAVSQAQSGSSPDALTGTFHGVHGVFYENGKPADRFSAPLVTANNADKTLTATGGVTVVSIGQAGASLRADKMIWHSGENKLVGVGHVVFKKGGITQTMPSFQADTALKKIVTPAPGLGAQPGRPIHSRIREGGRSRR